VEDLPRFGIAVWIIVLGLQRTQNLERSAGEFRIDQYILQRNDQAIAAEWSDEPRRLLWAIAQIVPSALPFT